MDPTRRVAFGSRAFQVRDLALGIVLKEVIDAAQRRHRCSFAPHIPWLRVVATIDGYALDIDGRWGKQQVAELADVTREACSTLRGVGALPGPAVASWSVLGDLPLTERSLPDSIDVAPLVEVGAWLVALLEGTLPRDPPGGEWHLGFEGGAVAVASQASCPGP